jgi:hypothetical protein
MQRTAVIILKIKAPKQKAEVLVRRLALLWEEEVGYAKKVNSTYLVKEPLTTGFGSA